MEKFLSGIIGIFESLLKALHVSQVLDDAVVVAVVTEGCQVAFATHPELRAPALSVSQMIIDGIDGKTLLDVNSVLTLINTQVRMSKLDPVLETLIADLAGTYYNQLMAWFAKQNIGTALSQLVELRKLAVIVNNAAKTPMLKVYRPGGFEDSGSGGDAVVLDIPKTSTS